MENRQTNSIIERIRAWARAFVLGPAVVERSEETYGHDESPYSPAEYGNYIATSNAVYACSTLRADTLSGIPLKCYSMGGGKRKEVADGPVTQLMRKVNDFWTMNRLMTMTELSLCLWGKAYWAVEKAGSRPREIWWMRPDRVKVFPHPTNYVSGFEYEPVNFQGNPILFEKSEIVWFRYPNPLDEYSGLSPLAASRLAADLASAAAKSNKGLFDRGYQPGGIISPPKGMTLTPQQAKELELQFDKRFKGVDKAHRWAVLRFEAEMKSGSVTPKDAEFLGTLTWSLEEVARAYKVPLDMIGGQRTYENVQAAERAFWYRTMEPESRFIASEIVEQLLPMFGNSGVDLVEFDLTKVPILQEAESERWQREYQQIQVGAVLVNEWRESQGKEPVKWGDAWWAPLTLAPVRDGSQPTPPAPPADQGEGGGEPPPVSADAEPGPRSVFARAKPTLRRAIEYGSEEHERLWRRFERREGRWEELLGETAAELFKGQKDSVVARLKASEEEKERRPAGASVQGSNGKGAVRTLKNAAEEPFDMAEWIRKFREKMRPKIKKLVEDTGQEALDDLKIDLTFNVKQPAVARFIERRAQRFAVEVNETTWNSLRESLGKGLDEGEGLPKLMERVEEVMAERIRSSKEVIARTEVIGAMNGGTLESWKQSEVVSGKEWLASLDGRERESHGVNGAHGQVVGLDEDFQVGSGSGPHPGAIGLAEEDINCRCTMVAVLKEE